MSPPARTSPPLATLALAFVDRFLPDGGAETDPLVQLRQRLCVALCLLIGANSALFGGLHLAHHVEGTDDTAVAVLFGMAAVNVALPFGLRRFGLRWLAPGFVAFTVASVATVAVFDGGARSGAVLWLVVLPLAAFFLGGARLGLATGAASAAIGVALGAGTLSGAVPPGPLGAGDAAFHWALNFASAALFVAALAAFYERPMVGHLHDLSGRLAEANAALRAELEARTRAQARAEEANRAKDSLLENMSHEVRTPLTAILGGAEVLAGEVAPDQRDLLLLIDRGARRLSATLNGMLDLAWIEGGASALGRAPVDVAAEATAVAEAHRPAAEARGLRLDVRADPPPPPALANRDALRRALAAVVDNAVRFTERGGVTVTVDGGADGVRVRVADTGIGMGAAFVARAREPFAQESSGHARTHEGTGIGLSVADRLVASMGGAVRVESVRGVGTAVTVALPPAEPAPAAPWDGVERRRADRRRADRRRAP